MKARVVLSSVSQIEAFLRNGYNVEEHEVFCDNERLHEALRVRNIPFDRLDEYVLREKWDAISSWGCGKASRWIRDCEESGVTQGIDYFSVLYLYFSVILMFMLKSYFFAKELLSTPCSGIIIFEDKEQAAYPDFHGNAWLNFFLKQEAIAHGIPVTLHEVSSEPKNLFPDNISPWKRCVRKIFKRILRIVCRCFFRSGSHCQLMVYGSLRHLGATMLELKKRGHKVFLYDDEFHSDLFKFALKNGIPYLIRGTHVPANALSDFDARADFKGAIQRGLALAKKTGFFVFEGADFSDFIEKEILSSTHALSQDIAQQTAHYEALLRLCPVKGLLVEEDFHSRAFLAAYFRHKGIPVMCNSHANLSLNSSVGGDQQCFAQSLTFVNSQQEKEAYAGRGWDPEKICVSGLPRYDRLTAIHHKEKNRELSVRPKVLYCATFLWPFCPDVLGYIGCDIYSFKEVQVLTVKTLLDAAAGLDLELLIKPHYAEDEGQWAAFLKEVAPNASYTLLKASRDYMELLGESDAMVLSSWSSTLMEAGIRGIPSFYVDVVSQNSRQVLSFAKTGLCEVARSSDELRHLLEKLCAQKGRWDLPLESAEAEYYLGHRDGKSTERVVDRIEVELHKTGSGK